MTQDNLAGHLAPHESWKYILRVMEDETIIFKTQLADILSNDFERRHLVRLEVFQHRFLKMDEQIGLLRHEVRELQMVAQQNNGTAIHPARVTALQEMLMAKMDTVQDNFETLASDFKTYLHKYFPSI
jgi:predicted transcriptional regulator